jgi:hypothetical protein
LTETPPPAQDAPSPREALAAWERFYSCALSGYLSDPNIDPGNANELEVMVGNCAEIADASLVEWRLRWAR